MIGGFMSLKVCTVGIVIPLAAALAVSTAPVASAAVTPQSTPFAPTVVRDLGVCSARSEVTLDARNTFRGRVTLELRLFANRAGQPWRVLFTQNGAAIANRTEITRPLRVGVRPPLARRVASLEVRQVAINTRGADRFMARATNLRTGETCTARVLVRAARPIFRPPVRVLPPIERVRPPIQRIFPPIERVRPPFER
jgi:hypothetical protein